MDQYYQIARELEKLSRNDLAIELRKFHHQAVDQVVEEVLCLLGAAEADSWPFEEIRKNVREIEGRGIRIAHDRMHLRRCEAVLAALRERKVLIVAKKEVARAYDEGDGVDIDSLNETALEVKLHQGKHRGA